MHVVNETVKWTKPSDLPFIAGIYKVFAVPPRNNKPPILPFKLDGDDRLLFAHCAACAKAYPTGGVKENYSCEHSDEERGFVCNCTSAELFIALGHGWTVTKYYRGLQYERDVDDLFKDYIREFMKLKIEASGFDSSIKGNTEAEELFIRECKEQFQIEVDRQNMVQNKQKRSLAKLMLNNLWGRFGLRNFGLSQSSVVEDPVELARLLQDKSIEISSIDDLTADVVMVSYVKKEEFVTENESSNVVVSLLTTSFAR